MSQTVVVVGNSTSTNVVGQLTVQQSYELIGNNFNGNVPIMQLNGVNNPYSGFSGIPFTTTGSVQTFSVPAGSGGFVVQPNPSTVGSLSISTVSANTTEYRNPTAPFGPVWFDVQNAHVPASVFVSGNQTTGGNIIFFL
jgi:hypothetical protein